MGKRYFVVVFIVFLGLFVFADNGGQEEVDFLLFQPNSAEEFVDAGRAMIQLDNVAKFILGKNPSPGQVYVYGYTADVANDIDSVSLSRGRALLVIGELRKRGVAQELFSDPVAYGPVNLWGSNEEDRILNRRVRILLDGTVLTPAVLDVEPVVEPVVESVVETVAPAEPEIKISSADDTVIREDKKEKSPSKFPWLILLLLLLLAALLFLLSKLKKKDKTEKPVPAEPQPSPPPVIATPVIIPVPLAASVTTSEMVVNLDEEIRFRAYEFYLLRYGQNEDEINDWYRAVTEICGRYNASGYQTYYSGGSWWAKKTLQMRNSD